MQSAYAATEQQLNLWVDAATGSDSNSGAANFPLRTISAAVYKIPFWVRHPVTVHVHRGTYAERLDLQFMMVAEGSVTFIGEDWSPHSPRQGIRSGKFDSSFGAPSIPNTATCSAGGWGVDELKGTFVRITSGADTGTYLPVASNTQTSLDFGMPADRRAAGGRDLRGQEFELVAPAVIVQQQGAMSHVVNVTGTWPIALNRAVDGRAFTPLGVQFRNFQFNCGTAHRAIACGSGGALRLDSCKLELSPNTIYGLSGYPTSRLTVTDCYWAMHPSPTFPALPFRNFGVLTGEHARLALNNCIMDNGRRGVLATRSTASISGLYQNQQEVGLDVRDSTIDCSGNIVLRGQPSAVIVSDRSTLLMVPAAGCGFIRDASQAGIAITQIDLASAGGILVRLRNMDLDACGSGVLIDGSHNTIQLLGSAIRNSPRWGLNLAGTRSACFNAVSVDSASTMSGNISGDFSLDGTNAVSLAALRSSANREIVDSSRLSRLFES